MGCGTERMVRVLLLVRARRRIICVAVVFYDFSVERGHLLLWLIARLFIDRFNLLEIALRVDFSFSVPLHDVLHFSFHVELVCVFLDCGDRVAHSL